MIRHTAVVLVLAAIALSAAPADAQAFKWWQSDRFRTDLALTTEQSNSIEDIFQSLRPKLQASKEQLDRLEAKLSALIDGSATEADVMQQAGLVEVARAELSKARILMLFRMRRVLTPEQRIKFKALHDEWERSRHAQRLR